MSSLPIRRATNLASELTFSTIADNLAGRSGTTSYTDATATNPAAAAVAGFFYRVGVAP